MSKGGDYTGKAAFSGAASELGECRLCSAFHGVLCGMQNGTGVERSLVEIWSIFD
jgi:hypothetical protein